AALAGHQFPVVAIPAVAIKERKALQGYGEIIGDVDLDLAIFLAAALTGDGDVERRLAARQRCLPRSREAACGPDGNRHALQASRILGVFVRPAKQTLRALASA